jgi:hypothetical protein
VGAWTGTACAAADASDEPQAGGRLGDAPGARGPLLRRRRPWHRLSQSSCSCYRGTSQLGAWERDVDPSPWACSDVIVRIARPFIKEQFRFYSHVNPAGAGFSLVAIADRSGHPPLGGQVFVWPSAMSSQDPPPATSTQKVCPPLLCSPCCATPSTQTLTRAILCTLI